MNVPQILSVVCALGPTILLAQEAMPQLEGLRAPSAAEWTIEYKYPEKKEASAEAGSAKKELRIKSARVLKVDGRYHETIEMEDGSKRESWVFPDIQLIRDPQTKVVQRLLKSDLSASDYSQSDFPGLEWVSGKHPAKVVEVDGRRLYLLEVELARVSLTNREKWIQQSLPAMAKAMEEQRRSAGGKAALTLDMTSRLPVTLDLGNVLLTYSFVAPSTAAPQMDADFQAAREAWERETIVPRRRSAQP